MDAVLQSASCLSRTACILKNLPGEEKLVVGKSRYNQFVCLSRQKFWEAGSWHCLRLGTLMCNLLVVGEPSWLTYCKYGANAIQSSSGTWNRSSISFTSRMSQQTCSTVSEASFQHRGWKSVELLHKLVVGKSLQCHDSRNCLSNSSPHMQFMHSISFGQPRSKHSRSFTSPIVSKAPSATGPEKTVKIYCAKCDELLYLYRKAGKGALVKCFKERIAKDYTNGDLKCPQCGIEFARPAMIRGKPANKMIGGKVTMRK
jgi:hypothetical protein